MGITLIPEGQGPRILGNDSDTKLEMTLTPEGHGTRIIGNNLLPVLAMAQNKALAENLTKIMLLPMLVSQILL